MSRYPRPAGASGYRDELVGMQLCNPDEFPGTGCQFPQKNPTFWRAKRHQPVQLFEIELHAGLLSLRCEPELASGWASDAFCDSQRRYSTLRRKVLHKKSWTTLIPFQVLSPISTSFTYPFPPFQLLPPSLSPFPFPSPRFPLPVSPTFSTPL